MCATELRTILPDSAELTENGLAVGGCSAAELAEEFGTPLYVYDEATLRAQARRILTAFEGLGARVSYASKACAIPAVLRVLSEEGLDLDAVSEGELEAGRRAGFAPDRMHLHGNNKTDVELETAVRWNIRAIVVDNVDEIGRLEAICRAFNRAARIMIRVALPLEVQTHAHLRTSGSRSKFGVLRGSADEATALSLVDQSSELQLTGIHVHLGSQITDVSNYKRAAAEMVPFARDLRSRGFPIEEVSMGGGWAVAYRPVDSALDASAVAATVAPAFAAEAPIRVAVEPGRSVVARAGMALYRVGSVKRIDELRIIAIDGGMGDNPRPALYGSHYTVLPNRISSSPVSNADVVGRYCESGDVLARSVPVPEVSPGELLCVPVSGAYHVSLASNYNLVPQPAVVMVSRGSARVVVRRATLADMFARDVGDPM